MSRSKSATLFLYCKTPEGWRRLPVVFAKNGRLRPLHANYKGIEAQFPSAHYEIRTYSPEGKRIWENVGVDAADALNALNKAKQTQVVRVAAKAAGIALVETSPKKTLVHSLENFIKATEARGSYVAARMYRLAVNEFLQVTGSLNPEQVSESDLLNYQLALRKRGCSDRTVHNRHNAVTAFLRSCGVDLKMRRPKFEKTLPDVYTQDQMIRFFALLKTDYHKVVFGLALQCGLREQELMHVEWADINFKNCILEVRSKPLWGFTIKDNEERDVPIPQKLLELLRCFEKYARSPLVTGTSKGKPNTKLLRTLKRLVSKSDLRCKRCSGCLGKSKECEQWFLHKFRATYTTRLLRSGMDLRTVMQMTGHSDLKSVMRYLRPAEGGEVQQQVNAIQWE